MKHSNLPQPGPPQSFAEAKAVSFDQFREALAALANNEEMETPMENEGYEEGTGMSGGDSGPEDDGGPGLGYEPAAEGCLSLHQLVVGMAKTLTRISGVDPEAAWRDVPVKIAVLVGDGGAVFLKLTDIWITADPANPTRVNGINLIASQDLEEEVETAGGHHLVDPDEINRATREAQIEADGDAAGLADHAASCGISGDADGIASLDTTDGTNDLIPVVPSPAPQPEPEGSVPFRRGGFESVEAGNPVTGASGVGHGASGMMRSGVSPGYSPMDAPYGTIGGGSIDEAEAARRRRAAITDQENRGAGGAQADSYHQ